jgi:hypothetical protein
MAAIKSKVSLVADDIRSDHFVCDHDHSGEAAYNDLVWLTGGGVAAI